jgi:DivIVA domain-containing protein
VEASVQEPSIERIRNATFSLTVRGYDRNEVDAFLAQLADWLETGGGGGAAAVEAVRTELERIGEHTAGILTEAHQAAEAIRADAAAGVRQQLVDANSTAERVRGEASEYAADTRDEADAYARKVRGEADAYASRTTAEIEAEIGEEREAAEKEAARIVADANKRKADVESVIGDLEKRRDAVLAELERLASGLVGTATEHRGPDAEPPDDDTSDKTNVLSEETEETTVIAQEKE